MRVLLQLAFLEDQDTISVDDGGQAVGHNENCAVLETLTESALDEVVSFKVDVGSGLIEDKHLGFADYGTSETKELLLTDGE